MSRIVSFIVLFLVVLPISFIVCDYAIANSPQTLSLRKAKADLIAKFELLVPKSMKMCNSESPWLLGYKVLQSGRIGSGECFGIGVELLADANLYIFMQSGNGLPIGVLTPNCDGLNLGTYRYKAGSEIRAPIKADGSFGILELDDNLGDEWIFAVATGSPMADKHFRQVIDTIGNACESDESQVVLSVEGFVDLLRNAQAKTGSLDWKALAFMHD